ncbi:MAG TPA: subclass B1 metallo-beta-lactamase [Cytophagales bacterium]|nr:subclass B1 metallo-beta-lactamase [Cytophagales bacterium]HAA22979.1 subclass B1 metallo-beta-lactamase [Cytophagales bacterium]HAP57979.1 subclass B1 metallo-beta-lactamase [Cytophagales bacterium]
MPHRSLFAGLIIGLLLIQCAPKPAEPLRLDYTSEDLVIEQVSAHCWRHVSYLQTESFGKVGCNGLIYLEGTNAWVFDTPADMAASQELIAYLKDSLGVNIAGVVATHSHEDCLAGLDAFHNLGVPSLGYKKTVAFAKESGLTAPQHSFASDTTIPLGKASFRLWFPGAGHTLDNSVVYIPGDSTLFGGCLIKTLGAGYGYLGDAHVNAWPQTVQSVLDEIPEVQHVVPGHGSFGNDSLLYFTSKLFRAMPDSVKP